MIFGKRGIVYRLILNHFVHTFSLSYFFRLIATVVGSYSRSRRQAQERSASVGGQALRRIYGHIVAHGFGSEKLIASLDVPALPRRGLGALGQVGMASVIVVLAWFYWPGEAAAPAITSAAGQPVAAQSASSLLTSRNPDATFSALLQPSAESRSPDRIEATRERFAALTTQTEPAQGDKLRGFLPLEPVEFGAEMEDTPSLSAGETEKNGADSKVTQPEAATPAVGDESAKSNRPDGLPGLFASLADLTASPRGAVRQMMAGVGELATGTGDGKRVVVEAQPTSTPAPPTPTPGPPVALVPGPQWLDFTPAAPAETDHFWLGLPHPAGYNELYSPNYQFGSTAGNRYRIHHGVDISNDTGTPVLAMGEGEVVHAGPDNPVLLGPYNNFYGNAVVIRLNRRLPTPQGDQDVYLLLGHMSAVYVERGQQVQPEDVVGAVGMTGIAIGPHLHVEVRVGQNSYLDSVNPALWVQNAPGTGAVAARLLSADGRSWSLARLSLLRYEGGASRWVRTLEIYPDQENISADPAWGENSALSNLAAGAYWIGGVVNGEKFGQNITINAGETTFVELRTQQ